MPAQTAKDIQFYTTEIVSLTAQLDLTTTDKPVSSAWLPNSGTEQTVTIDVQVEEYGMLLVLHAFAQEVNSGTDSPVLSVQTEKPGTHFQINATVQSAQPGMESLVSPVLEEKSIIIKAIHANAHPDKLSTDTFAQLHAQPVKSIMKPLSHAPAQADKIGTETSVFTASAVKFGMLQAYFAHAQLEQFGTDSHAITHAMEEELLTLLIINVYVQTEIGMESLV